MPPDRRLHTAELLSVGTELTVGDTRDTNAGDIARDLVARGVTVGRLTAVPDRLPGRRAGAGRGARGRGGAGAGGARRPPRGGGRGGPRAAGGRARGAEGEAAR